MRRCRCLQKSWPVCTAHLPPPRAPFTELSRNDRLTKRWNKTQAIPLPHWKYIFVLFLRSVNSALFCSPSFKGNLIPSRPWGRSRSRPAFWLTSLRISFTVPACLRLSSANEKKLIPHALLSMQRDIRCICRNPQPRGPMKAAFLCSHVPLPLISSYFTRGAVNRPLSLPSPSSYRLKRGNHDSDPSSSILSSFLLNLSVL